MIDRRLFFLTLAVAAATAAADLPTGEQLMNRHVEVTGGAAAWKAIKTQQMEATTEIVGQGVKGKMTLLFAGGDRNRIAMNFEGMGEMHSGVAPGGKAWANNAMQGPRLLEGAEKKQAIRAAKFNVNSDWKSVYSQLKTEAAEEINGQPAWRVAATMADGDKNETVWFDQKSGRIVRTQSTLASPMGDIPVETNISDYRKIGTVEMPFVIEQKMGPGLMRTTIDSIKFDVEIPAEKFTPPEAIQALMK